MKVKQISEERILQITNDIAEDMGTATKEEYRQTIRYWIKQHSDLQNTLAIMELGKSSIAVDLMSLAARIVNTKNPGAALSCPE